MELCFIIIKIELKSQDGCAYGTRGLAFRQAAKFQINHSVD